MSILKDSNDKKSSKRISGLSLIGSGGLLILALGIVAMFKIVADAPTTITCGKTLIIVGAGLLGVGVVEGITKK